MKRDSAEAMALQALAWLAADDDRLTAFIGESGAEIGELRASAGNPEFLGGVLDYLLGREWLLTEFCAAIDCKPDQPMRARHLLPGASPEM